jgi:hypothetical protein
MNDTIIEVTEFTATVKEATDDERPAPLVRVRLTLDLVPPVEFFLSPPEALELADKLRPLALRLGR